MTALAMRLDRLERATPPCPPPVPADPVALATAAGVPLDPWQQRVVRSRASQVLINASRQSGKSTVTAVVAVHTALRQRGALVLLVSRALRQSAELFKKCQDVYRASGRLVPLAAETALTLTLENGARIVSLPGSEDTVRGYSGVALLVFDEASRVPDGLYRGLRPVVAVSAGRVFGLSTPFGRRGWWWDAWEHGGAAWERYRVPATECPRISAEFLAEEAVALGEWWYQQEYCCEFMDSEDSVFSHDAVMGALRGDILPLFPDLVPVASEGMLWGA